MAVALLTWHRLGTVTRGTAWAEDAGRFLAERLALGPIRTLWHPYDGYQHLVPRVLTDIAVALQPIDRYAVTVAGLSCLVVGFVAACVFVLAREVVRPWPLRVLLAAVPAFVPLGPIEIAGNMANLHWFLLFLAPWVFAARIRSWWAAAWWSLVALAVTGTEIQAAVFLPLFLLGVRNRRTIPVAVAALLGMTAQLGSTVLFPRDADANPVGTPRDTLLGYLLQPFGGTITTRIADLTEGVVAHGWVVLAVPALAVLIVVVLAGIGASFRAWIMLVALGGGSVAVWVAAVTFNPDPRTHFGTLSPAELLSMGSAPLRYAAASSMFLLAAVVVAAGLLVVRRRLAWQVVGWAAVVAVVTVAVLNVDVASTRRSDGPVWSEQVDGPAAAACTSDPSGTAVVTAAPVPTAWAVRIPCALIADAP